jgi:hypothetical protein
LSTCCPPADALPVPPELPVPLVVELEPVPPAEEPLEPLPPEPLVVALEPVPPVDEPLEPVPCALAPEPELVPVAVLLWSCAVEPLLAPEVRFASVPLQPERSPGDAVSVRSPRSFWPEPAMLFEPPAPCAYAVPVSPSAAATPAA